MAVLYRSPTYLVRDNPANGGDTVVVMFDPWSAAPGDLDGEFFAESFFRRRAIPAVGIKAARNDWYLGDDMDAVLDAVRTAAGGRRVVAYGASMGGYAALNYHAAIGADRLLLFAPQFSVDPSVAPFETRYRAEAAALDFARDGIGARPRATDGFLFYDPATPDALHARLILASHPLTVVPTAFAGHHPLALLHETRLLEETIHDALSARFDAAALLRALRRRRRRAPTAWTELAERLHARGRDAAAERAHERATRCRAALAGARQPREPPLLDDDAQPERPTPPEAQPMTNALAHGSAQLEAGVRLHYVVAGAGPDTIVLLHGYPQTWWEWRHVVGPLAAAGWRVVAPDYRGAGQSSKPQEGYDKRTMAADIRELLRDHLGVAAPITLVGHDIGMMVAYAYASSFPADVARLVLMEAPLPGTTTYDTLLANPRLRGDAMWHFRFHNADDSLAESLTAGRERVYVQSFFERFAFDPAAIDGADVDRYALHFSAAGAMRAGFELYRAFDRDADDNRAALAERGKLTMPVLALGGADSFFVPIADAMLGEVAEHVTVVSIPRCGHWVAEEQPAALVDALTRFVER